MNHSEAEMSDVLVVLDVKGQEAAEKAVEGLKAAGLEVVDVNGDEGVIEGSIEAAKVSDLKHLSGVCYVRSVFNYTADHPLEDSCDREKNQDEESDADC